MKKTSIFIFSVLLSTLLIAQDFSIYNYRNVGPLRGGRVTAVAGTVAESGTFFLGATGGGVWKTTDYGLTWKNVSDGFFETPSIGSIAIDQKDPNIVYVGTGSDGLRSNVITGKGVYKSVNGGISWENIGLKNVGQIGKVLIHPDNYNVVYVAAIGQAFNANSDRGVYKTVDGGKTWEKILYLSDKVGFYDLEFVPGNPNIVFATAWKAERKPWTIISGGTSEEGGIYKSMDGGKTWEKIEKGIPNGLIGKIDLAVSKADSKLVYALLEAPEKEGGVYISEDQGNSFTQVSGQSGLRSRPFYYTNIVVDPNDPKTLYVLATGYYKSTDGGKNWKRISSPHGDNHDLWINPNNSDLMIQSNDGGANVSFNGGESWTTQFNQSTAEIYQVEVDDQFPYWLYGGQQDNYSTIAVPSNPPSGIQNPESGWIINTGGCETGPAVPKPGNHNIVYANCKGRFGVYNKITGTEKAYYVGAANMYGHNPKDLKYRFQRVSPIHVSPHNPDVIYHTSQFVHRTTDEGKTWETISPDLTAFEQDKQVISGSPITRDITGEEFYSTIYSIRESPIKQGVIWTGANDGPVHVTKNNGESWENVTPKKLLPGGRVDAVEPSPHNPAKAYVSILRYQLGDWKPYIFKTEDYGKNWTLLTDGSNGIPADYPTRVIREDLNNEGILFAGTEFGMFISLNDGKTWQKFQKNLPATPITDIKLVQNDLVLSTMGRGFWVLDDIHSIGQFKNTDSDEAKISIPQQNVRFYSSRTRIDGDVPDYERPSVPIDFYIPEDIKGPVVLEIYEDGNNLIRTYSSDTTDTKNYSEVIDNMRLSQRMLIVSRALSSKKGWNRFKWDMTVPGPWSNNKNRRYQYGPLALPGKYKAIITFNEISIKQEFELVPDPRLEKTNTSIADIEEQYTLANNVIELLSEANKFEAKINEEIKTEKDSEKRKQLEEIKSKIREKDNQIYPQPKLIDQIEYLYYMVARSDQKPGKDTQNRYVELRTSFDMLKSNSQL